MPFLRAQTLTIHQPSDGHVRRHPPQSRPSCPIPPRRHSTEQVERIIMHGRSWRAGDEVFLGQDANYIGVVVVDSVEGRSTICELQCHFAQRK